MARSVKCLYCEQQFYRENEDYVQVSGRYAHKHCYEVYLQKQEYRQQIHQRMQKYCGTSYSAARINKQLKNFVEEKHFTEEGILNTIIYWFEIRGEDPEKSYGGIGIVPYVYNDAQRYFKQKQENEEKFKRLDKEKINKEIENRDNKEREVCGKRPKIIRPRRVNYFDLD